MPCLGRPLPFRPRPGCPAPGAARLRGPPAAGLLGASLRRGRRRELLADRAVNLFGAGLSWLGLYSLIRMSLAAGDPVSRTAGYLMFGIGFVSMTNLSAIYHLMCWDWRRAEELYSLDKVGINLMIIGAYTPVCLQANTPWILAFVYILGCAGLFMEAYALCGRQPLAAAASLKGGSANWTLAEKLNLLRYLLMGWAIVFAAPVICRSFPTPPLLVAAVGGFIYTSGVVFLVLDRIEFHLAIWHSFVLIASLCFYMLNVMLVGLSATI
ncbi:unnamed protein product [Prorocentrum cordatum]|uniref:Uncharacterized protein n=1 Tax=Prorocentrum cordatum TaxID=2364126 RepID=A0ABN9R7M1_9DINO|nr:unnamed protein product [Polarella glacialis]